MEYSSTTLSERTRLARSYVDLYRSSDTGFWIVLGKNSPWPNEDQPPLPLASVKKIPDAFQFFYIHTCINIYDNIDGTLYVGNKRFSYIDTNNLDNLSAVKANKVYFEAIIPKEFDSDVFTYRILGICSDLKTYDPLGTLGPGYNLTPDQVESYRVNWIQTTPPISVSPLSTHVIQKIREF